MDNSITSNITTGPVLDPELNNKNKLTVTGSPKSFYATSNNTPTINLAGSGQSDDDIKGYINDLYANAFGRDAVWNDDISDTADYWLNAVKTGHQGDRNWQDFLDDSIYGSKEYKRQGPGLTPHDWKLLDEKIASVNSGGGRYKGPTLEDFQSMLQGIFSNPWTPYGFGWGGTNSDAVRINQSQASRRGSSYAGNKSSFDRSGSRLNSGTPWMNTLGM